ncbi:hypothetical protein CPB84DRAFT_1928278, partial [Gymnopilus junonius]
PVDFTNQIFDGKLYDPDDETSGLFRGFLLVRVFQHIFTGPSSALEASRDANKTKAKVFHIKKVTGRMIAYAAVQTYLALSSTKKWTNFIDCFGLDVFYDNVVSMFEENEETQFIQDTLDWWQSQVPGLHSMKKKMKLSLRTRSAIVSKNANMRKNANGERSNAKLGSNDDLKSSRQDRGPQDLMTTTPSPAQAKVVLRFNGHDNSDDTSDQEVDRISTATHRSQVVRYDRDVDDDNSNNETLDNQVTILEKNLKKNKRPRSEKTHGESYSQKEVVFSLTYPDPSRSLYHQRQTLKAVENRLVQSHPIADGSPDKRSANATPTPQRTERATRASVTKRSLDVNNSDQLPLKKKAKVTKTKKNPKPVCDVGI